MRNVIGRQRGGTILGLIIGLVAGLAIALVVALMITKSPVPFNKQSKSDKPSNSSVAPGSDPNQSMYRIKDAPKDAAKDGNQTKPAETAAAQSEAKPEAQAGDKAAKSDVKEAGATAKPGEDGVYYLQAGAYKNSTEAEGMRAKLALLGYEASISEMISQNGTLHRVRIGPFTQAEKMNRTRAKLAENGVESTVTKMPK